MATDPQIPELHLQIHNHSAVALTLSSITYGSSNTPPPGTDSLPAALKGGDSFSSHNLASSISAKYVDSSGNSLSISVASATPATAWQSLTASFGASEGSTAAFNVASNLGPRAGAKIDATVDIYGIINLRLTNNTAQDVVLTSTDHVPQAGTDTVPLVVPAKQSTDFKMSTWPKAFANFALKDSDWNASWALVWWEDDVVTAKALGHGRHDLDVATKVDAGPPAVLVMTFTPNGAPVPIAPSNGKFQIWQRTKDGTVACWRADEPESIARGVAGVSEAVDVALAGFSSPHGCANGYAVTATGRVVAWLDDGSAGVLDDVTFPSPIRHIAADGFMSFCVLLDSGDGPLLVELRTKSQGRPTTTVVVNPFDKDKNPGGITDAGKEGFSVQDLRLTAMAWHLGDMLMNGAFASVDALNTWLGNNISTQPADPESNAPPAANPSGPLLNDLDFKTKH